MGLSGIDKTICDYCGLTSVNIRMDLKEFYGWYFRVIGPANGPIDYYVLCAECARKRDEAFQKN